MRVLIIAIAVIFSFVPAHAASRVDCGRIQSAILHRAVPYCVMLPPSYDQDKTRKFPVVYYLHGLGDNEQSLINAGGWNMYDDLLSQKKVDEFLIVTPYGYQSFFINSRDGKFRYEDFFLREFMPQIEKKYRVKPGRASHGIMGISMGGFGALHYAFKYPQKFAAVSTHMAALMDVLPKNIGDTPEGKMMGTIFGSPIDEKYYQANNPLSLARMAPVGELRSMKIYFDVGDHDHYGSNVGNAELDRILKQRKVLHEFHIFPGGHDMAFVLQHFAASLEWQAKALK